MGLCVQVQLMKPLDEQSVTPYFNSNLLRVVGIIDDDDWFETIEQVICQINIFCTGGSGWVVQKLINVAFKVCKSRALSGSSHIPTPPKMEKLKKSLLNIKNVYDDICLLYCVAAALFPVTHDASRSSNYSSRLPELIFDPNNMPMKTEHIPKLEQDNSLSITVFHYREYGILTTCYWRKRRENVRKKINLVLLTNAETSHYCLLTNFQNLMHEMCRSYEKSAKENKTTFCANCMQSMLKKNFNDHTRVCSANTPLRIEMSSPETKLKFCNCQKTQRFIFTVYADSEALLVSE